MKLMTKNTKVSKAFNKGLCALQTIALTAATTVQTLAMDFDSVSVNENIDASQTIGKIIGMVLFIFRAVGAVLVIFGVAQVVQSFGDNNGDQRQKGIIMALAGIILVALKSVLGAMGIIGA